jgi:hypothetical protein
MSTLAYATLTTKREKTEPGQSVSTYVDALAALVPAEVLTLHAVILSVTTKSETNATGQAITTITEPSTLKWAFYAMLGVSIVLFAVARRSGWERWDFARALIPPIAFVGWTMLQKSTAFDAIAPDFAEAPRYVIAAIGAVVIGATATALAYKADQSPPGRK